MKRREFLKTAGVTMLAVSVAGTLGGCEDISDDPYYPDYPSSSSSSSSSSSRPDSGSSSSSSFSSSSSSSEVPAESSSEEKKVYRIGQSINLNGVDITMNSASMEPIHKRDGSVAEKLLTVRFEITNNSNNAVWFGHLISIQEYPLYEDIHTAFSQKSDFTTVCEQQTLLNAQDASYMWWNDKMLEDEEWAELENEEPLPVGGTSFFYVYIRVPAMWDKIGLTYKPSYATGKKAEFVVERQDLSLSNWM